MRLCDCSSVVIYKYIGLYLWNTVCFLTWVCFNSRLLCILCNSPFRSFPFKHFFVFKSIISWGSYALLNSNWSGLFLLKPAVEISSENINLWIANKILNTWGILISDASHYRTLRKCDTKGIVKLKISEIVFNQARWISV